MNVNPADFAGQSGLPDGERPALSHGMGAIAVVLSLIGFVWLLNAKDVLSDRAALSFGLGLSVLGIGFGFRQRWLDEPVAGKVVRLGVPVIFAMLSQAAINVVDLAFVGRLPAEVALPGVAAIGISMPVFWLVGGFLSAIGIGTQALTARRHGEGDDAAAGRVLMSGAALAFVLGVGCSILGYLALPKLLPLVNGDLSVVEQSVPFARIRYIGISSMVITAAYKAFFDGTGRTHVHLVAAIVMNVINLVLCYGLIFGKLGMPRLEVAGAAWASTLSSAVGTLVVVGWSFLPSIRKRYGLYHSTAFSPDVAQTILRVSLPSGGATVIGMGGFLLFNMAVGAVDAAEANGAPVNASATAVIQQIVILVFLLSFACHRYCHFGLLVDGRQERRSRYQLRLAERQARDAGHGRGGIGLVHVPRRRARGLHQVGYARRARQGPGHRRRHRAAADLSHRLHRHHRRRGVHAVAVRSGQHQVRHDRGGRPPHAVPGPAGLAVRRVDEGRPGRHLGRGRDLRGAAGRDHGRQVRRRPLAHDPAVITAPVLG
jgi:putative MATE family efflux protein